MRRRNLMFVILLLAALTLLGWKVLPESKGPEPDPDQDYRCPIMVPVPTLAPTEMQLDPSPVPEAESRQSVSVSAEGVVGADEVTGELTLYLHDRATGLPISSSIELWQIGLPGDELWRPGNVLRHRCEVLKEGVHLVGLPAGRYRTFVKARSKQSQDPEEFAVVAGSNVVNFSVDLPRTYKVQLVIFDSQGKRIETAKSSEQLRSINASQPAFARERRAVGMSGTISVGGGFGGHLHGSRKVQAKPSGFDLGLWSEMKPTTWVGRDVVLAVDGCESVKWVSSSLAPYEAPKDSSGITREEFSTPLTLVSVALPKDYFLDSIFLPDGRRAEDTDAEIEIEALAVPLDLDLPKPWLSVPIRIRVAADGYDPLTFEHRLDQGLPPMRVLVFAPSD